MHVYCRSFSLFCMLLSVFLSCVGGTVLNLPTSNLCNMIPEYNQCYL